MIGDLPALLNKKAQVMENLIRSAGHDPMFGEADEDDLDDSGYYSPSTLGIGVTIGRDGLIDTFHIHASGHHGYRGYDGPLPEGLSFAMCRDEVRSHLNIPEREGGPVSSPLDLAKIFFDLWQRPAYSLHCEYPEGLDRIQMVTITRTARTEQDAGDQTPAVVD